MYMGRRDNFAIVTEDDPFLMDQFRVFFPEGRPIKSFIMNKTNKVLNLDISLTVLMVPMIEQEL